MTLLSHTKYYTSYQNNFSFLFQFVRRILRQILVQLSLCNWNINRVSEIANIIETTILVPDDHKHITPLGLKLHLSDIILEELAKIGREDIRNKALLEILKPFLKVCKKKLYEVFFILLYCSVIKVKVWIHFYFHVILLSLYLFLYTGLSPYQG